MSDKPHAPFFEDIAYLLEVARTLGAVRVEIEYAQDRRFVIEWPEYLSE